jgi:poly-gamma-glutamate synthesis protein (capsule biosynthesis protein)
MRPVTRSDFDPGIKDPSKFDRERPLSRELQTNVRNGFTLVTVGDCIISRPLSQYLARDKTFAQVVDILRSATIACGNMETSILDSRHFKGYPYPGPGDVTLLAPPEVAKDLAQMGFNLVSRANNHSLDWGIEGMRETSHWLEAAEISYAGLGENLGRAQAPGYFESAEGRIGLVSIASSFPAGTEALASKGAAPGRPGINALHLKRSVVVTAEQMTEVVRLRNALYPEDNEASIPEELFFLRNTFVLGETFGFQYSMDANDLSGILHAVRQGKQHSDFLIATMHSHEPAESLIAEPMNDFKDSPAKFLEQLAHQALDCGADAFVVTGIHHLGPLEIYNGKPIFYGMGNFFWGDIQEPMPSNIYRENEKALTAALIHPERATDADLNNITNALSFAGQPLFDSMIAKSRFNDGRVVEIELHPVDLGYGKTLTESGTPRVAGAEQSRRILQRLQVISEKYGTNIQIEGSIGLVRP